MAFEAVRGGSLFLPVQGGRLRHRSTPASSSMNKSVVLAIYLTLSAAIAGGIIYGAIRAGYPLWLALATVYLLFVFLNGSLAYMARARRLRLEGQEPPPYLMYLFFPPGAPKLRDEAPKSLRIIVGIVSALGGMFFVGCGLALFSEAEFSRITHPTLAAFICAVLAGIGVALLYVGWRLIALKKRPPHDAA